MAESYPIDSSSDPQVEPLPQTTDTLTTLYILGRRLKKSLNAVQRLKMQARAEQGRTGEDTDSSVQDQNVPLSSPTGMRRIFDVSFDYLETEEEYFSRFNVGSLSQLLEIASNILESYCGLLSKIGEDGSDNSVFYSMAGVLRIALDVVICATELCDYQERALSQS